MQVFLITHLYIQSSNSVVCQYLLVSDGHLERAKTERACLRPVLLALGSCPLQQVSYHHDGGSFLLPHHPPEINQSYRDRTYVSTIYLACDHRNYNVILYRNIVLFTLRRYKLLRHRITLYNDRECKYIDHGRRGMYHFRSI